MNFNELRKINVNSHVEKKNGLTYLSWAWAWDEFKQAYPDATYKVIKSENGLPYFESNAGVMVYTEVTADNITHEMWLPVMDGANNAMKAEPYSYTVWDKYKNKEITKNVSAFDMFDINKTIMRCLVKNLAMFGLGLYIYSGEDLPEENVVQAPKAVTPNAGALDGFTKEEQDILHDMSGQFGKSVQSDPTMSEAKEIWASLDNEQKTALWSLLDSKTRSTFKKG